MSIASFVQTLKGYKVAVYVFANSYTNDPKYMVNSMKDLRNIDNSIDYREGLFNKSAKEHIDFIKKLR